MDTNWRLFQYVSPNGREAIVDWRKSLPVGRPRAYLDTFLRDMVKKENWEPPDLEPLHGAQRGLLELRWKCDRVPHRIVGYVLGRNEYVMLIGCTHREGYDPPDALTTALVRWRQIQNSEASFHEYQLVIGR